MFYQEYYGESQYYFIWDYTSEVYEYYDEGQYRHGQYNLYKTAHPYTRQEAGGCTTSQRLLDRCTPEQKKNVHLYICWKTES